MTPERKAVLAEQKRKRQTLIDAVCRVGQPNILLKTVLASLTTSQLLRVAKTIIKEAEKRESQSSRATK